MELEIKDVDKSFGSKEVLKNLSFKAASGHALDLLGRNGAGKTTTIRIITGVFKGDKGTVLLDGEAINYDAVNIGYLPEERGLYPKKKIKDQLVYLSMLKGLDRKTALKEIDYWMEKTQMSEYLNSKLDTLSKGNQQKIQFVSVLVSDPDIIILDEPFSGLDPVNASLLEEIVQEMIEKDKIVIFSSHQMGYVEKFCDHIAILDQGNIVLYGALDKIKKGYDRSKIVVEPSDMAKCQAYLDEQGFTYQVKDNELLVQLASAADRENFMAQISQAVSLEGIRVFEPSLNDIFVEYTGGERNETV